MPTNVIMPQMGESVVEGTVSRWLKQEGEAVAEFELIVEIETDKVTSEIPSPAGGVLLKVYVAAGQTVNAGTLLATIGQPEEAADVLPGGAGPAEAVRGQRWRRCTLSDPTPRPGRVGRCAGNPTATGRT